MKNQLAENKKFLNSSSPYIIAEIGANHNGDMSLAKKLIIEAKAAGADCVKFQSWTKNSVFSEKVYKQNRFIEDDIFNIKPQYSLFRTHMLKEMTKSANSLFHWQNDAWFTKDHMTAGFQVKSDWRVACNTFGPPNPFTEEEEPSDIIWKNHNTLVPLNQIYCYDVSIELLPPDLAAKGPAIGMSSVLLISID